MRTDTFALVCALLVISIRESITAGRGFKAKGSGSHGYPHSSGGLSGAGSHGHGYPSSGGYKQTGSLGHGYSPSSGHSGAGHQKTISRKSGEGSHRYPVSVGQSGGGSHGYPGSSIRSGGGSHGSPSSPGGKSEDSHGTGFLSSSGIHRFPSFGPRKLSGSGSSNNTHHLNSLEYLAGRGSSNNTDHSNSHGYPAGNIGGSHGSTTVHYPYNYSHPKTMLHMQRVHGGAPVKYSVYKGPPPTHEYKYKDSGSKYGTSPAGLFKPAKIAPGTAAPATAHNKNGNSHGNYKPQPGEYCLIGVKKDNGNYEETSIDCQLIPSLILQADQMQTKSGGANKTTVTTTVTNITTINLNGMAPQHPTINTTKVGDKLYQIMADGTLVPVNETALNAIANANGITSVVTTVSNTTTVIDDLDVKSQPIAVTPGMQCFVIRHTSMNIMRKTVPCGLLQKYAEKSLKANLAAKVEAPPQKSGSAARNDLVFIILAIALGAIVLAIVLAAFVICFCKLIV